MRKITWSLSFLLSMLTGGFAQAQVAPHYDQHIAFNPLFYPDNGTVYRSAGGTPRRKKYWNNRADYKINATLRIR